MDVEVACSTPGCNRPVSPLDQRAVGAECDLHRRENMDDDYDDLHGDPYYDAGGWRV